MYKLLLIWRYLLTRYIALVCVISITLGVATMIVVNAVMLGFSREMETRIHGVLSDVTVSSRSSLRGFDDVDQRIKDVWKVAGDSIESVTPTVTTPGLLSFDVPGGEVITSQVQIIGIDEVSHEKVTTISQFLQHPANRKHLSFKLYEDGYDPRNPLFGKDATERTALENAGWIRRRSVAKYEKFRLEEERRQKEIREKLPPPQSDFDAVVTADKPEETSGSPKKTPINPYDAVLKNLPAPPKYDEASLPPLPGQNASGQTSSDKTASQANDDLPSVPVLTAGGSPLDHYEQFQVHLDKETQQETGIIVGMGLLAGRRRKVTDPETNEQYFRESLSAIPGDDVTLSFLAVGTENALPTIVYDRFTITDLYECRMSEYDSTFVYVPIHKLQNLRKMIAGDGTRLATHLLIKAKPGVKINELRDKLQESTEFPPQLYLIETWRDKQETILAAVATELSILNVLLFLIIAVAGFGILAIFFMIVVEKTKDIGILKSLGAGGSGILQIFLFYGLSLGLVGAGFGLFIGLLFVKNINGIAAFLSKIMGHEVFDPSVYMFQQVPAIIEPWTVFWIMAGAIFIAVLSGVLPAIRAAKLHPVDALRI